MSNRDLTKNQVIWDGAKEGFYEAFYIQINEPVSGMAWWLRYSILIPQKNRGIPYAALWAVQFDPSGKHGPVAMKNIVPISHFSAEKDRFIVYIEDGFLTNSHARGAIKHGSNMMEWDVQWSPLENTFVHFPKSFYDMSIPKSKLVSPHWATTGGGFIRWNRAEHFLKDALVHVGHVWGTSHSKKWVWVRSHGFEENPTAVFEGLFVPLFGSVGVAATWLNLNGKLFHSKKIGSFWKIKKLLNENTWDISGELAAKGAAANQPASRCFIEGKVIIDPSEIAGLTYHDPDGSKRYCYNSKVSSIRMSAEDAAKGEKTTLNAPGTAAFEICLPNKLDKFNLLI